MTKKSIQAFLLNVVLLASTGWGAQLSGAPATQAAAHAPAVASQVSAFWQAGNGHSALLMLKNTDGKNPLTANVTLFSAAGQLQASTRIQIAPNSISRISPADVLKAGTLNGQGGMTVEFSGTSIAPAGKTVFTNLRTGATAELPLFSPALQFDSENAVHAAWLLPDNASDGRVLLFNAGAQVIVVSPSLVVDAVEHAAAPITLAAHGSRELTLRSMLPKDFNAEAPLVGSVLLRYTGAAGSLRPALLVENATTGFSLPSTFTARHDQPASQSTAWVFPGVSVAGDSGPVQQDPNRLRAFALVSNGTKAVIAPEITLFYEEGGKGQNVNFPLPALAPLETRLLSLSQFVDADVLPASITHFSLRATHPGAPGDVGFNVFSVRPGRDLAVNSPGALMPEEGEISFWDSAAHIGLIPKLENSGATAAGATVTLFFPTAFGVGSYIVPDAQIKSDGTQALDLRNTIHAKIPDSKGNLVPGDGAFGIMTVVAASDLSAAALNTLAASLNSSSGTPTLHFAALANTGTCAPPPPQCATVTNFHQVGSCTSSGGVLGFVYAWSSTSGNNQDIAPCTLGEIVSYPGTADPYIFPSPPYNQSIPNPFIKGGSPAGGGMTDTHRLPGFQKPYAAASAITAVQYYRYKCPCSGGTYTNLMGPNNIVRTVTQNSNGSFKYTITKSGCSSSLDPIP